MSRPGGETQQSKTDSSKTSFETSSHGVNRVETICSHPLRRGAVIAFMFFIRKSLPVLDLVRHLAAILTKHLKKYVASTFKSQVGC